MGDDAPRSVTKPDGRVITLATRAEMKESIKSGARALDVRDPNEVEAKKGGTAAVGAVHVPVNVDGQTQKEHKTTPEEYKKKLADAGVDVETPSAAFIVHCTGGGRADTTVGLLKELGFASVLNGGGPDDVRLCVEELAAMQCKYYKSTSPWAEMCPRLAVSTESSSPSACSTILGAGLKLAPIGTRVRRRSPGRQGRTIHPGGRPP
eukprot:5843525-Prymnesium_polylepis.1